MGKRLVVAVSCLLVVAGSAVAGGKIGAFYSIWDAKDLGSSGLGLGAKLGIPLSEALCIELRGSYYKDFDDAGDESVAIPVEVGIASDIPLGDALKLYGGGGAGYYLFPKYEADLGAFGVPGGGMIDVDPEDVIGFYALAGLQLSLGESAGLFVEGMYRSVKFDKAEASMGGVTQTIDAEGDAGGIVINAGLAILW